jgi:hypothetical protein
MVPMLGLKFQKGGESTVTAISIPALLFLFPSSLTFWIPWMASCLLKKVTIDQASGSKTILNEQKGCFCLILQFSGR